MTIYGADFSHYDQVPKGADIVAEGFTFMTHKAGGDADDTELGSWWSALKPQRPKVLLGAYWVLYPGTPATRANAFIARLDSQCPGWRDGPFILQLDCEIWGGNPGTQPGKADIKAACDRLKVLAPKLTPVVYASKGQYGNRLYGLPYPLWNANYPSSMTGAASAIYAHAGGTGGPGWGGYSGQDPAIWQFTSSATIAGQTTCDANAFEGTLDELTALVAPGWSDDMELTDHVVDPTSGKDYGTLSGVLVTLLTRTATDAMRATVWNAPLVRPESTTTPPETTTAGAYQRYTDVVTGQAADRVISTITPLLPAGAIDPAALEAAVLAAIKTLAGGLS